MKKATHKNRAKRNPKNKPPKQQTLKKQAKKKFLSIQRDLQKSVRRNRIRKREEK